MDKFKQYLLATAGLAILVGGLTLLGPAVPEGQPVPPAKDVNVINDATNPVPVLVQNSDGNAFELVEITGMGGSSPVTLFTVPSGKRVIITDVIFTISPSVTGVGRIMRNSVTVAQPSANPAIFYSHTYASGIEFVDGDKVNVVSVATDNFFELRGVMMDL